VRPRTARGGAGWAFVGQRTLIVASENAASIAALLLMCDQRDLGLAFGQGYVEATRAGLGITVAGFIRLSEARFDPDVDPDVAALLERELERQRGEIELIASENFTWPASLEAVGSVPTNKYSEGYPGRRYYGGCEVIDEIEQTAIDRAKELFGAEHANVQAHAGAQTNMAVYLAALQPGDTILSLELSHGGHLTHGLKVNFSGRLYTIAHYGVNRKTNMVD